MKVTVERQSGVEHRITVELEGTDVTSKFDSAARDVARKANVPGGYTKMNAKIARVKQLYRKQILADVATGLMEDTFALAIQEKELKTIGMPRFTDVPDAQLGQPFVYSFLVETFPVFEELKYEGLVDPVPDTEVSDEDVDQAVEKLRKEHAQLVPYDGDTVVEELYLTLDVDADEPDEAAHAKLARPSYFIKVNDDLSDALRAALLGKSLKETVSYQGTTTDMFGYDPAEFGDKTFTWTLTFKEVRIFKTPEANDDFAKEARNLSSLLALRGELREELAVEKKKMLEDAATSMVKSQLIHSNPFDLPAAFVSRLAMDRVNAFRKSMEQYRQSLDPDMINQYIQQRETQEIMRTTEEAAVYFLCDAIATKENLEIADEDIEKRIETMAAEQKVEPAMVRAKLDEEGMEGLKSELRQEKALARVRELGVKKPMDDYMKELEAQRAEEEARAKAEAEAQAATSADSEAAPSESGTSDASSEASAPVENSDNPTE